MLSLRLQPFPELNTPRLHLRQVAETDVKEIFFLRSDPQMIAYLDRPPAPNEEAALQFIRMLHGLEANNESVTWAITYKDDPKLLGTICFWNLEKEAYRAEIGYALHSAHHGKGIMAEAMDTVLQYGFTTMQLHSVAANVNPNNTASIRLLERAGFIKEGYFRENYYYDGQFKDSAMYGLLEKDWKRQSF